MGLYTFFVEKDGTTSIEQFSGADVKDAVANWYLWSEAVPGLGDPTEANPVPIIGTKNVWCFSGLDAADALFLVHVSGPLAE
jgi:hypothetical protein